MFPPTPRGRGATADKWLRVVSFCKTSRSPKTSHSDVATASETGNGVASKHLTFKVVVIAGASSELRKFSRAGSIRLPRSPRRPGRAG